MKNASTALAYILGFFGSIAGVFFNTYMLVNAEFDMLPIAEFPADSLVTSHQFMVATFSTLTISCMFMAWGVLRMLDRRHPSA
jgi:uncharacterized membrane protein HdeD (DUF308 family)